MKKKKKDKTDKCNPINWGQRSRINEIEVCWQVLAMEISKHKVAIWVVEEKKRESRIIKERQMI